MTNAREVSSAKRILPNCIPTIQDSLDPIIPKGTRFLPPSFVPKAPATADSSVFNGNSYRH
jgi:penicillin amidase